MQNIIFKFISWLFNREKKVDKQKESPIVIIGNNVIVNIKEDDDDKD